MTFGEALEEYKKGRTIKLPNWKWKTAINKNPTEEQGELELILYDNELKEADLLSDKWQSK